ncbi:lipopolysaccharide ABC transporter permease [Sodalis-like endosymbiont of Proechinophthirus fluctus]|uniref:LPS export ABC transporter permease LptF n=1 Tax=Sodalis-like endosymbiont of Proechinophthirus fluctus TaxID=1462730 RepID=UPI0007A7D4AD|nr:LPS export ABC transporter permease LptF [Sodalis-like endosymbiont of Proechinophthirus fluctus]KYP95349.1 lipopolysaccharide ABC transporter permease [Sodalis-like endosymbiont of Proechinophthirus fluctus]
MIITSYLVRETFKSQLAILFILLLIFFCQKLVRILGTAVDGDIPTNLVLPLLGLGVPEMAQLILPLSLFLGLLMTLSRMYNESEITVMHACGLGKSVLIRAALVLSLITAIVAAVNVIWLSPCSSRHQDLVMSEAKANLSMAALIEGQFKPAENGNLVLFVGNVKDKGFEHVFLAQLKPNGGARPSVVIADRGHMIQRQDGSQLVMLDKGTRYEGTAFLHDFRITDFKQYKYVIGHRSVLVDSIDAEQMTLRQLWRSPEPEASAELHWRLTLVVSVLIMAMMVVPLSVVNPRQGQFLSMLSAMLLYLIFFLLQTSMRSNAAKGNLNPMMWMWLTNMAYLALAMILNLWDSVLARRLRARLHAIGAS